MEASKSIKKTNWAVFSQCAIVICCVWLSANWIHDYKNGTAEAERSVYTKITRQGLPVSSSDRVSDYPNHTFKSDKAWNAKKNTFLSIGGYKIEGSGRISDYSVKFECVVADNGSITGRYHNENGVSLDVNGYIDNETNQLKIRLGHKSYISYLLLSPVEYEESNQSNIYKYSGTWGKKKLPAEISFIKID